MASVPRDLSCWTNSSSKSLLLSGFLATPTTMILAGRVWYDGSFQTEVSCVVAHAVSSIAMRINKPNGLRSDRIIFCSSFSSNRWQFRRMGRAYVTSPCQAAHHMFIIVTQAGGSIDLFDGNLFDGNLFDGRIYYIQWTPTSLETTTSCSSSPACIHSCTSGSRITIRTYSSTAPVSVTP